MALIHLPAFANGIDPILLLASAFNLLAIGSCCLWQLSERNGLVRIRGRGDPGKGEYRDDISVAFPKPILRQWVFAIPSRLASPKFRDDVKFFEPRQRKYLSQSELGLPISLCQR